MYWSRCVENECKKYENIYLCLLKVIRYGFCTLYYVRYLSFSQYDLRILSDRITCKKINTIDKRHKEFSVGKP